LVWSTSQNEVIASGELESIEQLATLQPYADKRTVIALIDSQDINLKCVDIPAGGARQLNTLLPFMFEDDIAQDTEAMHFSILHKSASNAWVAAIDKSILTSWMDEFSQHGIAINKVLPDVLALPEPDDSVATLKVGSQWLLRKGKHLGMVVHQTMMPLMLHSKWMSDANAILTEVEAGIESSSVPKVLVTSFSKAESIDVPEFVDWDEQPAELPMALLAQGAIASKVNLLSGVFKKQSEVLKDWRLWRFTTVLIAVLIGLMFGGSYLDTLEKEQQAAMYRSASEDSFRNIFPNKQRIPTVSYLKRQMDDEVTRLSGGQESGVNLLPWLAQLPQSLADIDELQVVSINYDSTREELKIQAQGDDFQVFEQARSQLEQKFKVVQGQLNRSGDKVLGDFTLTQGGASNE
jgi:general secretion pathway protein L